ncbi:MAG: TrfB-related DNA-binding protein [Rhodoferax sp.]
MIEKRLTEDQFRLATEGLPMGQKNIDIAMAVLVEGRKQSELAAKYGLTKGAVSQVVAKVWQASQVPAGYERVSVVLPEFQAFQVKQWAAAAVKHGAHQVTPRAKTAARKASQEVRAITDDVFTKMEIAQ